MTIKLLRRQEIDDDKWNICIDRAEFPSIFAKCWYLDIFTSQHWQGLVCGDYEAVMPLFVKKKWFISYITQPFLCQQGGVFSLNHKSLHTNKLYNEAVKKIYSLNILTRVLWTGHSKAIERVNHILDIDSDYETIRSGYNRNTIRNIQYAEKSGIILDFEHNPDLVASFLVAYDQSGYMEQYSKAIRDLIGISLIKQNGFVLKATLGNQINSIAYFIEDNQRLYFLLCASDPIGKASKSMYLLIDNAIKSYAGKKKVFDFTGSLLENIARRNIGFGAKIETYYQLKWNRFQFFFG